MYAIRSYYDTSNSYDNKGFAIKNVHERIKLLYGDGFGLEFYNNDIQGAIVKVIQPLIDIRKDI